MKTARVFRITKHGEWHVDTAGILWSIINGPKSACTKASLGKPLESKTIRFDAGSIPKDVCSFCAHSAFGMKRTRRTHGAPKVDAPDVTPTAPTGGE